MGGRVVMGDRGQIWLNVDRPGLAGAATPLAWPEGVVVGVSG